ncbi:hypothetical protein ACJ72_02026 [Emergomyces africanus]|uniref:Uncharacterized protein n=1 Tax=Emergomyces africanus TaxID=1955775 RepID=A0A1B7P3M1_9EURO|nr:hypothetical protein ACJ72_02026 [Emergomyces africanus]
MWLKTFVIADLDRLNHFWGLMQLQTATSSGPILQPSSYGHSLITLKLCHCSFIFKGGCPEASLVTWLVIWSRATSSQEGIRKPKAILAPLQQDAGSEGKGRTAE